MLIYQNSSSNKEKFACNAVLVNDRYVITAAQCVMSKILIRAGDIKKVRLGNGNLDCIHNYESKVCTDAIDFRVEEVNIPDNYVNTKDRQDDIAVLRLDRIVEFTDSIRPVCLPGATKHIAGGQKLRVPSWGREIRGAGRSKAQVVVETATNDECSVQYNKVGVNIGDTQVCAGVEEGYNACDIISGAPLLKEKNGQFIMEGVLSFGVHCTVKGWPDVYVAISKYMDWIDSIINL